MAHDPAAAVSVSPTCGVPLTVGGAVFAGAAIPATMEVPAEAAVPEPSRLRAVTTTSIVWLTSVEANVYALTVAFAMSAQFLPVELQSAH